MDRFICETGFEEEEIIPDCLVLLIIEYCGGFYHSEWSRLRSNLGPLVTELKDIRQVFICMNNGPCSNCYAYGSWCEHDPNIESTTTMSFTEFRKVAYNSGGWSYSEVIDIYNPGAKRIDIYSSDSI